MTQTRQVLEDLRSRIISGSLAPGVKLNISALAEELSVSAGAVREGLAMLESESLVISEPQRGFRVMPISAEDLRYLVDARIHIEQLCIAESIRHGDMAWEGDLAGAFHRLNRTARFDADTNRLAPAWMERHADFHHALIEGCPNTWLKRMHQFLYRQSERYRQLAVPDSIASRDVADEHKQLFDAVLNRDVELAQRLMGEHLKRTEHSCLESYQPVATP